MKIDRILLHFIPFFSSKLVNAILILECQKMIKFHSLELRSVYESTTQQLQQFQQFH